MAYEEINAEQVNENSPLDVPLFGKIRDNDIYHKAEKLERDGSIPWTDDSYGGNNNLRQIDKIYLSNGSIFPDDYALLEGTTMIGAAYVGGQTTDVSIGASILRDTTKDFDALGVTVGDLVHIPSVYDDLMFQIISVGTTAITLRTSNRAIALYDIDKHSTYTIHSNIDNNELDKIGGGSLSVGWTEGTKNVSVAHPGLSRFGKVIVNNIVMGGATSDILLSYGDITTQVIGQVGPDEGESVVVYLRALRGIAGNIIVYLEAPVATNPANTIDVLTYQTVDVTNAQIALIAETEANS